MNEADIERLLAKFDQSSLQELKIDGDGLNVYFSKQATPQQPVAPTTKPAAAPEQAPHAQTANAPYRLKAPMVGIVYVGPSPDKLPYKAVGDHVKKGETICAIEAMKLINEVKSPVAGTIKKCLFTDGEMVEYDQPLFEIEED
ncbi:acetyl-CoA carboxylase biotin carboxyl carrier protein subunit [Fructilactobacillus myrtifloralis]|uniref:Biotin carboxyl carrier protein of acetyl-CoA carboxylase n=1 Tax=Fructilactobacillus myrtifloralis TaxID=2940301 RepID=A0ABY5BM66_9LACO|nr:acetyl-CoA carboxylase biotin carboxyl carrier protein subunit [Fructilactobacillus myrtifloralis]USS84780.1 acetyl-CoA carboxylase biotin carboxyl carrier protein subunit [Fructilactobacillus myrtifloralis]